MHLICKIQIRSLHHFSIIRKVLHGRHPYDPETNHVDLETSNSRLSRGATKNILKDPSVTNDIYQVRLIWQEIVPRLLILQWWLPITCCNTIDTKIAKYSDLAIEIHEQWRQGRVNIVSMVIAKTGIAQKCLKQYLYDQRLPTSLSLELFRSIVIDT